MPLVRALGGALVLLALWPMALLFPAAVPLGLGQVLERLEEWWARPWPIHLYLTGFCGRRSCSPWCQVPRCLRALGHVDSLSGRAVWCVPFGRRWVMVVVLTAARGTVSVRFRPRLSWGPAHAWSWLGLPGRWAWVGAGLWHGDCGVPAPPCCCCAWGCTAESDLTRRLRAPYFADAAGPGSRAVHPVSWARPVAGLGLALRYAGVALGLMGLARDAKLESSHERHHTPSAPYYQRHFLLSQRAPERGSLLCATPCQGCVRPLQTSRQAAGIWLAPAKCG